MSAARPRRVRLSEAEVVRIAAEHLEEQGYRVRVDLDGNDYFDLVARRGEEVGLVEAKVADSRTVLTQALKRRGWGDWTAVVLAGSRAAERLVERTDRTRARPVGVWSVVDGQVRVHRAATAWASPGAPDPYAELRERFRAVLDALDQGTIPSGVRWDGLMHEIRRASGGRGFSEWRLDEPGTGPDA